MMIKRDTISIEVLKMIKSNSIDFTMGYLNNYEFKSISSKSGDLSETYYNKNIYGIDRVKNISSIDKVFLNEQPVGFFEYKDHIIIKVFQIKHRISAIPQTECEYYIIPDPDIKIKLIDKTPLVTDETIQINHLLYKWSNRSYTGLGDKILTQLLKYNIRNEFKQCSKPLYRGFALSNAALKRLEKGKTARLKKTIFSSWSEDKEIALEFTVNAIFEYHPKNEVVININLFEEKVFHSLKFCPNKIENEVILLNSPDMLTLHPRQVVKIKESSGYSFFNGKIVDLKDDIEYLEVNLNSSINLNK